MGLSAVRTRLEVVKPALYSCAQREQHVFDVVP